MNKSEAALPAYSADKDFLLIGWDSPVNTKENYQMAKDMGLTHMFVDEVYGGRDTAAYKEILGWCDEIGLKASVFMSTSLGGDSPTDNTDWSVYPAVDMINYWDEPSVDKFTDIKALLDTHNTRYAGKDMTFYVNLNPAAPLNFNTDGTSTLTTFDNYVSEYCTKILSNISCGRKILMTDVYPLLTPENGLKTDWLSHLETLASAAKENDAEHMEFIQTYYDDSHRDLSDKSDLSYLFNVNLAYGVEGFGYFTYTESFLTDTLYGGLVTREQSSQPKAAYTWAQEINSELQKLAPVYLSFDWNGTMPVKGTEYTSYLAGQTGTIGSLTSLDCASNVTATQDTLIGQFEAADGGNALMITNFTDPKDDRADTVSLTFNNANYAAVYHNGETTVYTLVNGRFNVTLASGDGVFVVPLP